MTLPHVPRPNAPRRWPAFLILLVVFVFWANSFIAVRLLVGEDVPSAERLSALEFVEARFAPVAVFCLLWFALIPSARREARLLLRRHGVLLLLLAAFNVWGYNLAFGAGHERVAAGTGALIIVLNPILTFLLVVLLGFERATWRKALGLAVAFAGIYVVIVYGAHRAVERAYLLDALLLIGAPMSWAVYTVFSKKLLDGASALTLNFLILGIGSLPTLPLLAVDSSFQAKVLAWGPQRLGAALFLAFGCTLLAFWLWLVALKRLPATTAAAFVFLNPPLTLCFEWLWFGRTPNSALLLGGAIVLIGVFLATRESVPSRSRPPRRPLPE
ncbi:MAG: DMT family transporter [Deltaproteobacteria bacterium]|nr:DMT family transporter [Deltaproteobacteria bacterium]